MSVTISATTLFSDWPAERDRLGLVVVGRHVCPDYDHGTLRVEFYLAPATRSGERVMIDGEISPLPPEEPAAPSSEKRDLRSILAELVRKASQDRNRPHRAFLRGGLRIDVLMTETETRLQLSRPKVDPSAAEWDTTLRHLPYAPPAAEPKAMVGSDGRRYRAASWPTPAP